MNQLISLHIEFTLYMNKAELIASYGPIEIIGEAKKAVFNQNKIYWKPKPVVIQLIGS